MGSRIRPRESAASRYNRCRGRLFLKRCGTFFVFLINMIMATEKTMTDLEDLNRTLYDIGAQDLLDVWEAMETQDDCINSSSHSIWNNASSNSLIDGLSSLSSGPVLKDRLLTDTMLNQQLVGATVTGCTTSTTEGSNCTSQEDLTVNAEHSYSLGGSTSTNSTFGSDGDSMPESPLSLDDDMETECYPCIPMHSASNQKRMNHSTITMIKTEPLSEDVNVVVDDQENSNDLKSAGSSSLSHSLSRQQNLQKQAANTRKRSVQNQNQQLQQTQQNTTTTTTAPSRVQQHTIRLSRPKHPQSLLKQKPVTHTILVTTTPSGVLTTATSPYTTASATSGSQQGSSTTTKLVSSSDLRKQPSTLADDLHASLISNQPTDGCGVLILTEEEKKTLISEGYPIPSKLPLTKAEEKSLKKIRRKIKNKISAQESRRKKKEFVDTLERKVDVAVQDLEDYKKKCELLQKQNTSLRSQLKSLRSILANNNSMSQSTTIKPDPDCLLEHDNDLDLD